MIVVGYRVRNGNLVLVGSMIRCSRKVSMKIVIVNI